MHASFHGFWCLLCFTTVESLVLVWAVLMTPGRSQDIRCHVWPYFSKLCKSPDQATRKVGCQSGDCIWLLVIFLRDLCGYVWYNILTLSPPRELVCDYWSGFLSFISAKVLEVDHMTKKRCQPIGFYLCRWSSWKSFLVLWYSLNFIRPFYWFFQYLFDLYMHV